MAQTATWAVPAASSGLSMRGTVNTIMEVLRTCSSGASAPSPTAGGQFWLDTGGSPSVLRVRNTANTAWIEVNPETLPATTVRGNSSGSAAAEASITMATLRTMLGFSQVTGSPRRITLPGEMILQGGAGTTTTSGVTVTFPLAFSSVPTFVTGANSTGNGTVVFSLLTATSVFVRGLIPATGAAVSVAFNWVAFGE